MVSEFLAWVAGSGVVQGVIIGATLAFLTTILILNAVAKADTTTVNGWSAIRKGGQPGNGILVRAAREGAAGRQRVRRGRVLDDQRGRCRAQR